MLILGGLTFAGVLVLPVTPVPWNWYRAMAQPEPNFTSEPSVLVMMGGGGIPSESGLTRSYKLAEAAKVFPKARVIVCMPLEPDETLPGLIEKELMMRGVALERIKREPNGRNTREQALEVFKMAGNGDPVIGLVTSPEHMKRTWLSFRKAGFSRIVAIPSWSEEIKADLRYHEAELGSSTSLGGAVGGNDIIKYKFWDNLGILLRCTRETVAIAYYRLMGWV